MEWRKPCLLAGGLLVSHLAAAERLLVKLLGHPAASRPHLRVVLPGLPAQGAHRAAAATLVGAAGLRCPAWQLLRRFPHGLQKGQAQVEVGIHSRHWHPSKEGIGIQ